MMLSMGTLRAAQPAGCLALLALLRPDTLTAIAASVFAMMHMLRYVYTYSPPQKRSEKLNRLHHAKIVIKRPRG